MRRCLNALLELRDNLIRELQGVNISPIVLCTFILVSGFKNMSLILRSQSW